MRLVLLIMALVTNQSLAISKLYDADASAVIVDGKPCFFLPGNDGVPIPYLNGQGFDVSLHEISPNKTERTKWEMWMKSPPMNAPTSSTHCIPYGMASPDVNKKIADPLEYESTYQVLIGGEYGRYGANFCLRKSTQGSVFISKSRYRYRQWVCTNEPFMQEETFWKKWFGS